MSRIDRLFRSRFCLVALALACLPGAFGLLARGQESERIITDVRVVGAKRIPAERVLNEVLVRKGQPYRADLIRESTARLHATQWYYDAAPEEIPTKEGFDIVFRVIERPTIQDVVYIGVKHVKRKDLDEATGLRKGLPMSVAVNKQAARAIERKLFEKNRLFASVELLEGGRADDTRVVFNVTEGPEVYVNDIRFEGNNFVNDARLKTQIESGERWVGLFGGKYRPELIDRDIAKLYEYFRTFGFFDCQIKYKLEWNPGYESVDVVFVIDEGVRYLVKGYQVKGNGKFEDTMLLAKNDLKEGEAFNGKVMQASLKRMQDEYGKRGYVNTRVVPEFGWSETPGEVVVVYDVKEGRPARIGTITVVGNTTTRENVVRRQLLIYPGQILDSTAVRGSEQRLARLGIFKTDPATGLGPTIQIEDLDGPNDSKDVFVQVQEDRTGSIQFGLGFNSDMGASANIVLHERNFDITRWPQSLDDILANRAFRGAGQEFRMDISPGTELSKFIVSFREPYLFDSAYSLGTSAYYYTRRFEDYDEQRVGGKVQVGHRFTPFWSGGVSFRAEDIKVDRFPITAPQDFFDVNGHNTVIAPRVSLTRDSRDSFLRPTEGSLFEVAYEQAFGDFTYPILTAEFSKYFTTHDRVDGSGRHVLALRGQIGWAGEETPLYDRFYAGGFRTLRGFDFRGVGPDVNGFKVGGKFQMLGSVEYQIPIMANDNIYAVIFTDFGTVEDDVAIRDFRLSAGAGLRLIVPMFGPVPIALDWAYPITKAATDEREIFSFFVGFSR